jgi:hypothetical protein
MKGKVLNINHAQQQLLVRYTGWGDKYDEVSWNMFRAVTHFSSG